MDVLFNHDKLGRTISLSIFDPHNLISYLINTRKQIPLQRGMCKCSHFSKEFKSILCFELHSNFVLDMFLLDVCDEVLEPESQSTHNYA